MPSTQPHSATLFDGETHLAQLDLLVEAPLGVFVNEQHVATIMRSPGETPSDDLLLAQGLLFTRGIILGLENLARIEFSTTTNDFGEEPLAFVNATLQAGEGEVFLAPPEKIKFDCEILRALPGLVHRPLHEKTGHCPVAAIFNAAGERLCCFEDIHPANAVDKAIGHGLENYFLPATEPLILLFSSRVDAEVLKKALMARIGGICSLLPPSSSAVELATRGNLTLMSFSGSQGLTIFTPTQ